MTALERGFLLLTSHLGDPARPVLSQSQMRILAQRLQGREAENPDRELTEKDMYALGYNREMSRRIMSLLDDEVVLDCYLRRAAHSGCTPITRVNEGYPLLMRRRLGLDSPGCLWCKGDVSLLTTPSVSLVGCRELNPGNRDFARAVGRHAAEAGLTLISGNARGADREAQESCLAAGGRVISVVADSLAEKTPCANVLYLSEEDFDAPFSAQRALSRNRCIHALGQIVFVAQSRLEKGGTWSGTAKNLHFGWSSVLCFRDGSEAAMALEQMGAYLIDIEAIGAVTDNLGNVYPV